ncbi:Uncharacterised protein [Halioglobus japonicus]|nr:Uncharacterised protein [Halioglobus japonicus]
MVSNLIRKLSLYSDHLLSRNKYLSRLNSRILTFKATHSRPSKRVIDASTDNVAEIDCRIPEIDAADFSVEFLKKSMRENGCVIVRNFFDEKEVNTMKSYIDYSFAVRGNGRLSRFLSKQCDLNPVLEETNEIIKEMQKSYPTYANTVSNGSKLSRFLGRGESVLTVRTPNIVDKLLNLFEKKSMKAILTSYFGNEPCVSVFKWTMRRSRPPAQPIDFHQDGAFMGEEIASLNCWIPLSNCGPGYDVHGLDIVPKRLMNTFKTGSGVLDWTVAEQAIVDEYSEDVIKAPTFREGDLLFFDHLLLHRTQSIANSEQPRYAIETWFFDSVNFPKNQIPVNW